MFHNRSHAQLVLSILFGFFVVAIFCDSNCLLADEKDKPRSMAQSDTWPSWRGPLGNGSAINSTPPLEWSEIDGIKKNIRWKTKIQGTGHSTPVIWKDKIFLTAAEPFGETFVAKPDSDPGAHHNSPVTQKHRFFVICVERATGKINWRTKVNELVPHEGGHNTGSLASASPITDGKNVYAFFGSNGLYCLNFEGKIVWKKQLGKMHTKHNHGEGTSPALYGDTLIVNWDHQGKSFIVAFNKSDGKKIWRVDRDEVTSWSSPIIVSHENRAQVIVAGSKKIRGYDLETGKVVWECAGLSNNVVATPIYSDGIVYVGSSYEFKALFAIDIRGATGDLTGTKHVLWKRKTRTPYVPSPLLYKKNLYFLTHYQGIMTQVVAKTGEDKIGPFRLPGIRDIYASPVAANDRIYVTDLSGSTIVFSYGEIPRVLSLNRLSESISASAAIVGKEIFLRGKDSLYCIAED